MTFEGFALLYFLKGVINAIVKKIINIILISIMCFSGNGECSEVEAKQPNNKFAKNIIVELIGIDNTVVEFIEFIFN